MQRIRIRIDGTPQEIFDRVVEHLAQQKTRSFVPSGPYCAYRDGHGRSCAVGALISDDQYDPNFEDGSVWTLPIETDAPNGLLAHLQVTHDSASNADDLRMRLRNVATIYNLDPAKIERITEWSEYPE
jgi:hypothetical protein